MSDSAEPNAISAPLARVALAAAPVRAPVSGAGSATTPAADAELMLRYRDGDLHAFELLYARYKGPLYRYLQRQCRDVEAAGDLFQEVWGKVIGSRERYEVKAQFNTWLFRIAHNCAIDYFRRSSRQHSARMDDIEELHDELPGSAVEQPEVAATSGEIRTSFRRALAALPPEQRDVFLLYEEAGLTLEEIGRITGVAMETAKSRLRYALGKLRTALEMHAPQAADGGAGS